MNAIVGDVMDLSDLTRWGAISSGYLIAGELVARVIRQVRREVKLIVAERRLRRARATLGHRLMAYPMSAKSDHAWRVLQMLDDACTALRALSAARFGGA